MNTIATRIGTGATKLAVATITLLAVLATSVLLAAPSNAQAAKGTSHTSAHRGIAVAVSASRPAYGIGTALSVTRPVVKKVKHTVKHGKKVVKHTVRHKVKHPLAHR